MDWSGWKKFVELLQSNPDFIGGLVVIVGAVFGFAWWLRSHISKEHIASLNTEITSLQGRLREVKEDLRSAKEEQASIAKELRSLQAENAQLASTIAELQTQLQTQLQTKTVAPVMHHIVVHVTDVAKRTDAIAQANTALGTTLSTIIERAELRDETDATVSKAGKLSTSLK